MAYHPQVSDVRPPDPQHALLAGLVDDAGLFPPASLTMPDAVVRHRADLAEGSPVLTHRFLCPVSRVGQLRAQLRTDDRFRLALIADTGVAGLAPAVAAIDGAPEVLLASVEFPLTQLAESRPAAALLAAVEAVAAAGVADTAPLFVEPASLSDVDGVGALVAAIAAGEGAGRLGVKLRCGGITPELFPTPEMLASAIVAAASSGVRVKATAGLHHAVRHTDPETGFVHHGYLNLLVAVADAVAGADLGTVAGTLGITDPAALLARVAGLDESTVAATRRAFASYGSCSTSEPVDEAKQLGLL